MSVLGQGEVAKIVKSVYRQLVSFDGGDRDDKSTRDQCLVGDT